MIRPPLSAANATARPAYPLASALALLLLCGAEIVVLDAPDVAASLALLAGLGVLLGAAHGLAWSLVFRLLQRVPRRLQIAAWTAIAAVQGHVLAAQLGGYSRLSGPYKQLAVQVLIGSFALSVAFAVIVSLMQPTASQPSAAIAAARPGRRLLFAGLLGVLACALFYADQRYYVGLYPRAHDALRSGSWLSLMFAFVLVQLQLPRLANLRVATSGLVVLALVVVPSVGMLRPHALQVLWMRPWSAGLARTASTITDFDRDGYAAFLGGGDCDESNPRVHPGAREIPGNGIDDNCMLGDAPAPPPPAALPPPPTEPSPYDVVFVTVDTWRPDHLGLYNPSAYGPQGRATTPNLDAWAKRAVVFRHAYSPGGWTSIAVASMMRGQYPRRLDWTRYYETTHLRLLRKRELGALAAGETPRQMFPLAFEDPQPTLAGLLKRRGMRTAAVVHDGFSRMLTRGIGVERDFDAYWEVEESARERQDDIGVVQLASQELVRTPKTQRLFLWVHFFGPHSPNQHHPGTREYGPTERDGYDHELRFFDAQLPSFFASIARRGVPTVIVLVGDHGEVFAEPIRMHGFTISEEDLRVPLLLRVPGWEPRDVQQLVSSVDLFPTVLALTKTPGPQRIDGVDLAPWARDGAPARPRLLISETWRYEADASPIIDLIAGYDGRRKVVLNTVDHAYRAYDQRDPLERARTPGAEEGPVLDFLQRYVEETGGALAPRD